MKTIKCACGKYDLPQYISGSMEYTGSLVCSVSTHSSANCQGRWADVSVVDVPVKYHYDGVRSSAPEPPKPPVPYWRQRTEEWKDIERGRCMYAEDRQQWPNEERLRHIAQILTSGSGGGVISDNALCHALALIELHIGYGFMTEKDKYFNDHREFSLWTILLNLTSTLRDSQIKAAERIVGELMRRASRVEFETDH